MLLSTRNSIYLTGYTAFSEVAFKVAWYIFTIWILAFGENGAWLLAIFYMTLPIFNNVANFFSGAFADANDRKKIVVRMNLLAAVTCYFSYFFVNLYWAYVYIIFAAGVLSILDCFINPAMRSIVATTVKTDKIGSLNSYLFITSRVARAVIPFIGLFLYTHLGMRWSVLIIGTLFLCTAFSVQKLTYLASAPTPNKSTPYLTQLKLGFVYTWKNPLVVLILATIMLYNLVEAGLMYMLPNFMVGFGVEASENGGWLSFASSEKLYSFLLSAQAVGGVCGAFFYSRWIKRKEQQTANKTSEAEDNQKQNQQQDQNQGLKQEQENHQTITATEINNSSETSSQPKNPPSVFQRQLSVEHQVSVKKKYVPLVSYYLVVLTYGLGMILGFMSYSWHHSLWGMIILIFALANLDAVFHIKLISYMQEHIDIEYQGRVFSLRYLVGGVLIPLGTWMAAYMFTHQVLGQYILSAFGCVNLLMGGVGLAIVKIKGRT